MSFLAFVSAVCLLLHCDEARGFVSQQMQNNLMHIAPDKRGRMLYHSTREAEIFLQAAVPIRSVT